MMKKWLLLILFVPFTICAAATNSAPLQPDQAFTLNVASTSNKGINLDWKIAPGYHLYRDRIAVAVDKSTPNNAVLGSIDLPPGTPAEDPIQGKYQEYQQQLKINVPLTAAGKTPVTLLVDYQGCAEGSICYPPITKQIKFNLTNNSPVIILSHDPVTIPTLAAMSSPSHLLPSMFSGQPIRNLFLECAGVLLILILIQNFVSRSFRGIRRVEVE
jgi:thiol:disulfide interchange protein